MELCGYVEYKEIFETVKKLGKELNRTEFW